MFSQDDIDAVLNSAQEAVDMLSQDVGGLDQSPPPSVHQAPPCPQSPPPSFSQPSSSFRPLPSLASSPFGNILFDRLRRLKVPVVVRLAQRRMSLDEVLKIVPGTILEFDRSVDRELDLLVNHHQVGSGVAVKVDEHFGIRVTYIGDVRQRIQSLSG